MLQSEDNWVSILNAEPIFEAVWRLVYAAESLRIVQSQDLH